MLKVHLDDTVHTVITGAGLREPSRDIYFAVHIQPTSARKGSFPLKIFLRYLKPYLLTMRYTT